MPIELVDRRATRVATLRHTGPYGLPVGRFYIEQVYPWMVRHGLISRERYGIALDDPRITAPAACRYDACAALGDDERVPLSLQTTTLPAGRYAVQRFSGNSLEIEGAWQRLLAALPAEGLHPAAGPCFEHYEVGSRYDRATGAFDCTLCVPVMLR